MSNRKGGSIWRMEITLVDLPGSIFVVFRRLEELLDSRRTLIDRLNVFPVPDGDTGTNMLMTVRSVNTYLNEEAGATSSLAEVCRALSMAALLGARGNSGVILSQLIQGFTSELSSAFVDGIEEEELPAVLAASLTKAAEKARSAVLKPREGTILSVAAGAAVAATSVAATSTVDQLLEASLRGARVALIDTPNQLEQLRAAGVVDSGGAGFVHLIEALWFGFSGREPYGDLLEYPWYERAEMLSGPAVPDISSLSFSGEEMTDMRFEVMFLLRSTDEAVDGMKEVWEGIGDSIVVVGQDGMWNCHIHTNDIGAAIEAGIDAGAPRQIRVTDLDEQVKEEAWVRNAEASGLDAHETEHPLPQVHTAVVSVSSGEGITRIFRSLGVRRIVVGGQSMNPSTIEILEAIEGASADGVVVLPNNTNVIAVASAAAQMASVPTRVINTGSVIEGFNALMEFDPAENVDVNVRMMSGAASAARVGEVTTAVRPGRHRLGSFEAGEFIGLSMAGVETSGVDLYVVTRELLELLIGTGAEIVTLLEGEGSSKAITREITEWLREIHPDVQVEIHEGGQALYPYLIGVE